MKSIRDMSKEQLEEHVDALFKNICEDFGNKILSDQLEYTLIELEKREKKPLVSSP